MRLSKSDPVLKNLPTRVEETLPDWSSLAHLGGSNLAQAALTAQAAVSRAEIWSQASQIVFAGLTTGVGAPRVMFDAMVDGLGIDVQATITAVLEKAAGSVAQAIGRMSESDDILDKAVDAGVGKVVNLAAAVPIAGQVVKLLWNVGKAIADIVRLVKMQQDPKRLYPPSRFDPDADRAVLNNSVLSTVRGSSWSPLFFPPGYGRANSTGPYFGVDSLDGGGVRITTAGPKGADGWVGFIPGTAWLHQAIETTGPTSVHETGATLLPSATQQCVWLWRHIARNNVPATFAVDADKAASFWHQYIENLRVMLRETKSLTDETRAAIFRKYDRVGDAPVFGWGDGSRELEYYPEKQLQTLRKRQLSFCDTLTVAYVTEDFDALGDAAVKAKWEKRRRDLLEHQAVCQVDLSNVPDVLYRDEVEQRRKGHRCFVAGGGKFSSGASVPPPGRDNYAMPERTPPARRSSNSGSGLLLGGAAAALLLYLARR